MTGQRYTERQIISAQNALAGRSEMAGQPLTPAESALMALFHGGAERSPKMLAKLKEVSIKTVYLHIRHIKEKLGVDSLSEAVNKIFPETES